MKQKPIADPALREQLDSVAADGMDIFVLNEGNIRGAAVHTTRMVNAMRSNHRLGILETLILGHAYIGAALMTSHLKGRDRLAVSLKTSGPVGGISVESNVLGEVRGYLMNSHIPLDEPLDSFDTAPFIGSGIMTVTRFPQGAKQPFSGSIEVADGDFATNLARYYLVSEQTPTAFSLSVQFDEDGRVVGAGGLMIQALPEARQEALDELERRLHTMPSIGLSLSGGETPSHIVHRDLGDFSPDIVGTREVKFSCHCSKARFGNFVAGLPVEEIDAIIESGGFPMKTTCHNCNTTYEFSRDEVDRLHDRAAMHQGH
jgi:molecular chaperone Hsp33